MPTIVQEGNPCPTCQGRTHQFVFRGQWYRSCIVCEKVAIELVPRTNGAVLYDSDQEG